MDEFFMQEALKCAEKAASLDEVPVGAVIVLENKIIARGWNLREKSQDATSHAEIIAIKKACRKLNSWRLSDCELFVTLEPCKMCMGAIFNARIKRVVFGAHDDKCGEARQNLNKNILNHKVDICGGVLQKECENILKGFFKRKRK